MGNLLGEEIKEVTFLESAVLILSAVYHDIGMVFSEKEIGEVSQEDEFEFFMEQNDKAKLLYEENGREPGQELIEWYCRWLHAKRVWKFLNYISRSIPFDYGQISFKHKLGLVCESHNQSLKDIIGNEEIEPNFLGCCDLKFCAFLLRLADILDFDNTRSPRSVFEYLNLDKPESYSETVSLKEWEKHLCSDGFKFGKSGNGVQLRFVAAPTHPSVEVAIRKFLKVIEEELLGCSRALMHCSDRWRSFSLPLKIDKTGIISKNYKSGSFKFSLSEEKILNLLTGEGLYDDEFVFIRELLQNAIDTSRHREFLEGLVKPTFKSKPIIVSYFTDKEGYQWIRIDDYGRGMNEDIIVNHLLKKGESYYNSDRFKIEKLTIKEKADVDFEPISRFGIGLLSCFIVGDKIEINTKVFNPGVGNKTESYRISVEGRSGFFVLQSKEEKHIPSEMPSPNGDDSDYRSRAGTSIAVRLMPNKEYFGFNISEKLEEYVLCSPIPIKFEGKLIGGDFSEILLKPLGKDFTFIISGEIVSEIEEILELNFPHGIKIDVLPINISENSPDKNLKGQIIFIAIDFDGKLDELPHNKIIHLTQDDSKVILYCSRKYREDKEEKEIKKHWEIPSILENISLPRIIDVCKPLPSNETLNNTLHLSHNGIIIHDSSPERFGINNFINRYNNHFPTYLYTGILYFEDYLLPNLTVSRNKIKSLNFQIISNLLFSLKNLNKYIPNSELPFNFFRFLGFDSYHSVKDISQSKFYEENKAFWDDENLFFGRNTILSVNQVKEQLNSGQEVEIAPLQYSNFFYSKFSRYILETNFDIALRIYKASEYDQYATILVKDLKPSISETIPDFDSLRFISFEGENNLIVFKGTINRDY